jgi:hypothetical protein
MSERGGSHPRLASARCLIPTSIPPLDQEVGDLHDDPVCRGSHATGDAAAGDQASSVPAERFRGKGSPAFESERTPRLEHAHPQSARREVDGLAQLAVLPFRVDAVGVFHLAAAANR